MKINGKTVKPSYRLILGDRAEVVLPETADVDILPENIPLDILYEDNLSIRSPSSFSTVKYSFKFLLLIIKA